MSGQSAKWRIDLPCVAIVCASAVFVYLLVFKFPATPIYIENDSLVFLSDAQRMAAGQVIYRDFFQGALRIPVLLICPPGLGCVSLSPTACSPSSTWPSGFLLFFSLSSSCFAL